MVLPSHRIVGPALDDRYFILPDGQSTSKIRKAQLEVIFNLLLLPYLVIGLENFSGQAEIWRL